MNIKLIHNSPDQPSKPIPDVPPAPRPDPGIPKPGDPPGHPSPGDPPPAEPTPGSPGPLRPSSVLGIVLLSLIFSVSFLTAAENTIDSNDLLESVETELISDDVVQADMIDVKIEHGVVTLSGKSFTLLTKKRAAQLISNLKGVRAVVNQIKVVPTNRSDQEISIDIRARLRFDSTIDEKPIKVKVSKGHVEVSGTVGSYTQKQIVGSAIAGVRGVVSIQNKLAINQNKNQKRSDHDIRRVIARRFELTPFLAEGLIEIDVKSGTVTLKGAVGSVAEKNIAQRLAWVSGVRQVIVKELSVQWEKKQQRRRNKFTVVKNDFQLKQAVQDALLYDERVSSAKIVVNVKLATAILSGKVSSLAQKKIAEHDAKNTLGVQRVINHLKVKLVNWPGDLKISEQARQALDRDAHLNNLKINATSHFGNLYLVGKVNSHFERTRAEKVADNVSGVLEVVNHISVTAKWKPKVDNEILEDANRRIRWSPVLNAEKINVSVEDGVATVQGTVDTHQERTAAATHVKRAGAKRVINKLDFRSK